MPPLTSQWLLLLALGMGSAASAQEPALFKNADLKLGQRLIAENKCAECHARKWADDGNAIYRPKGRINTPALLQGMVERCSSELSLNLFPEEITAISAALDHAHYKFRDAP